MQWWPSGIEQNEDGVVREIPQKEVWCSSIWITRDGVARRKWWNIVEVRWKWDAEPMQLVEEWGGRVGYNAPGFMTVERAICMAWRRRREGSGGGIEEVVRLVERGGGEEEERVTASDLRWEEEEEETPPLVGETRPPAGGGVVMTSDLAAKRTFSLLLLAALSAALLVLSSAAWTVIL